MRVTRFFVYGAMCLAAVAATQAQERAAGSSVDIQTTWTALSNKVDAANAKSTAVDSRVSQMVVCNKVYKLYAPGVAGADASGCIDNKLIGDLTTRVTNVETNLGTIITNVTRIQTCGTKGQFTDGKVCIDAESKGLDHYEILYPTSDMSCTQKVARANQYVGHKNKTDYIGIPYSSRIVGTEGNWILDGGDSDCSPMSNRGRWPMIIPKDANNKPIKGFYKVIN